MFLPTLLWMACAGPVVDPCALETPELQVPCRIQQAADAAVHGELQKTHAICATLTDRWQQECHFRAGEELGRNRHLEAALSHCVQAGRYQRYCLTHVVWQLPVDNPGTAAEWAALATRLGEAETGVALRSRWWFNRSYGTGIADVALARSTSEEDAPHARWAWALEAVRLAGYEGAKKAWEEGTVLRGDPLPVDRRVGRVDDGLRRRGERSLPSLPTFGGGQRLLGQSPQEDLQICLVEALWFREDARAEVLLPLLSLPSGPLRYTAMKAYRSMPSNDPETTLRAMQEDPDAIIRDHVADALERRTWEPPPPPGLGIPAPRRKGQPDPKGAPFSPGP